MIDTHYTQDSPKISSSNLPSLLEFTSQTDTMFSFNPTEPSNHTTTNPLKHLFDTIFSYDGNVMLAALVSLLLVILFVLLLHVYAKWFLSQTHHRRRVSRRVLGPSRFQHFHTFNFDPTTNNLTTNAPKGLDTSTIAAIPLFVYKSEDERFHQHVECVICLSPFEDEEVGRRLSKCGHCFHVECVDMWLHSHTSCPICRAPVVTPSHSDDQPKTDQVGEEYAPERAVVIEVSDSAYVENHHHVVEETSFDSLRDESSSSPLMVGCSLKRMLSRSRPESKLFPSANGSV